MRARVVVFPVRGRNWCFSTSVEPSGSDSATSLTPSSLKDLFSKISFSNPKPFASNAQLLIDFVSNKMNKSWVGMEKAPEGTLKNKVHGLGSRLLARVKPSEMLFKSIPKEVTTVEITYPSSLNPQLVRRRLRHIAQRGTIIHKNYFYGSVSLLPLTTAFTVLPLPNIPFFWVLFRTYSHWRARQGSEQLLQLVSDGSQKGDETKPNASEHDRKMSLNSTWIVHRKNSASNLWLMKANIENLLRHGPLNYVLIHHTLEHIFSSLVLKPSNELQKLIERGFDHDGLSKSAIIDICNTFGLNSYDVLKYRDSM